MQLRKSIHHIIICLQFKSRRIHMYTFHYIKICAYVYLSADVRDKCIAKSWLIEETDFQVRLNCFPYKNPLFFWIQTQDVLDEHGAII